MNTIVLSENGRMFSPVIGFIAWSLGILPADIEGERVHPFDLAHSATSKWGVSFLSTLPLKCPIFKGSLCLYLNILVWYDRCRVDCCDIYNLANKCFGWIWWIYLSRGLLQMSPKNVNQPSPMSKTTLLLKNAGKHQPSRAGSLGDRLFLFHSPHAYAKCRSSS